MYNIYRIVDMWLETLAIDAMLVFRQEVKHRKAMIEKRLVEAAAKEIEQLGVVAQVEDAVNKKKPEIAATIEQIVLL